MRAKAFISITYLFSVLGFATTVSSAPEAQPRNLIIVVVDDMGYGDISAHGNPVLKTPNFDRLHDQSARFTNFSVSPSCAPTRAALMTGRHEFFVGVTGTSGNSNDMDPSATTIAQLFQKKGYKTGIFGKWHLGLDERRAPIVRGFDETLHVAGDLQKEHFDPELLRNNTTKQKFKGYREDVLFSEAMKFIEVNQDKPFFCYIPTYSPHSPNKAPDDYVQPYLNYSGPNKDKVRAGFCGQVANVDYNLGRLLDFLKSTGLEESTLLIAINDNGGTYGVEVYNAGMRGTKCSNWWGGTRAYSFWRWGTHFSSGVREQMAAHIDVLPTLADLFNLEVPDEVKCELDGVSLRPALENADAEIDPSRMQVINKGRWKVASEVVGNKYGFCTVRMGRYALVRRDPDPNSPTGRDMVQEAKEGGGGYSSDPADAKLTTPGVWELFDVKSDVHQDQNIAAHHPEIVRAMSAYYEKWWQEFMEKRAATDKEKTSNKSSPKGKK